MIILSIFQATCQNTTQGLALPPANTKQETLLDSSKPPIRCTAPIDKSYSASTDASPLTTLMCQDHGCFTIFHTSLALKGVTPYNA